LSAPKKSVDVSNYYRRRCRFSRRTVRAGKNLQPKAKNATQKPWNYRHRQIPTKKWETQRRQRIKRFH